MNGLIQTLTQTDAARPLFQREGEVVTAGEVRRLAAALLPRVRAAGDTVFLSVASAAHLTASLLAAAAAGRVIAMPAHAQPEYLAEIGCPPEALITDDLFDGLTDGDTAALTDAVTDPVIDFFTSGSSGVPKRVRKNLSRLEVEARSLDSLWGAEAGPVISTVSHQHFYGFLFRVVWPVMSGRVSDDAPAVYWGEPRGPLRRDHTGLQPGPPDPPVAPRGAVSADAGADLLVRPAPADRCGGGVRHCLRPPGHRSAGLDRDRRPRLASPDRA